LNRRDVGTQSAPQNQLQTLNAPRVFRNLPELSVQWMERITNAKDGNGEILTDRYHHEKRRHREYANDLNDVIPQPPILSSDTQYTHKQ